MNRKEKITLNKEQETLLIPLYAKAMDNPVLKDDKARQILESVQYDFRQLSVPRKTAVTLWIRARQLDIYAAQFIAVHPNALILHLGCGLDSRCMRIPHPAALWVDLDLPDVISLRRKFYSETETYQMLASPVTDPAWMAQLSEKNRPTLIVAEGLFMYLEDKEIRDLIRCLQNNFPGSELVFDAFSELTAARIKTHPSIQKTGASVHWGIDDPHEIEHWAAGIQLKEEWFFSQSPDISKLAFFYRLMFRLTAPIQAAKRAHRLLYYKL
jgi:O-methyltransferase involved in polyketide biosynthesis